MFLNKMSIRSKAAFGLILLTLFILLIGILNYLALGRLQENTRLFAEDLMPAQGVVLNADRDLYQALTAQQEILLLRGQGEEIAGLKQDFDDNVQQAKDRMASYLSIMQPYPDVVAQLANFERLFADWLESARQVNSLAIQGDAAAAHKLHDQSGKQFAALREQYNLAGELADQLAGQTKQFSDAMADSRQAWTLGLLVVALVCGLLLIYLGPKLIVSSVRAVTEKIQDINRGGGDLVSRLPVVTRDELGQLATEFNRFLDQLQGLVRLLLGDAGELEASTSNLRQVSTQVDDISENQRVQLASLVTAFNEINQAVHDISQHAQLTSDQTHQAQDAANQGLQLLQQNVTLNRQLQESFQQAAGRVAQLAGESEKITSVLDVIRGIAEQTNLLALNAAIEAARAGEQGRGFAVVADEVRTLASRTQRSTEDIQGMISSLKSGVQSAVQAMDKGSGQVENTVGMADKMHQSLMEIQQTVNRVLDMNFQIASATEEQSAVMDEINRHVSELNSLTEEGAATSGTVRQTGSDLDELARQLAGRVRQFKV
ncbi:methyl-accepting chemotaxis protein [Pseudaeromonas paramecii]|uniref:Methyl-accepting chemotaxis protein n=1 Tax=Pseudaeromonas paramecii TaxID=2138166 RepID=A0ABP8QI31_9GAMM